MKQFATIFRFELNNYLAKRAYRILTLLLMAAILIGMSWPRIAASFRAAPEGESAKAERTRIAVACAPDFGSASAMAERMAERLPFYVWEGVALDEAALTASVTAGEYDAGLWLDDALRYRYIVQNAGMYDQTEAMIAQALGDAYRMAALSARGLSPQESGALIAARAQGETVATGRDLLVNYIYTYALIMLLYMSVVIYGQLVASGVAAEKSSRAMELLITSANPTSLIFGKVLAAGAAGLLQMAALLGTTFAGYALNRAWWQGNLLMQAVFSMPLSIFAWALLFFVLGFFLYASLYGALGSLVSRTEDIATTTLPMTMFFIAAFFIVITALSSGQIENALMKTASLIPLTAPLAMFVRITMGAPAVWEIALSVGLLVAATLLVGYLSAGIYRVGVLLYGKPPKLGELVRAVRAARR